MTISDLIAKYIALRDHWGAAQTAFDAQMKPYKDGMEAIEGALTAHLLSLSEGDEGKRNVSIPGVGTAFRQQWTSAKIADRETFLDFVIDNNERQFLTAHVAKEAVKEYLDEHQGALPPGVDWSTGYKTIVRKA